MMTKQALRNELNEVMSRGDRNCKLTGLVLADLIDGLVFHGAGVAEFRGVSDAGLSDETLNQILGFMLPNRTSDMIANYLCGCI